MNTAPESCSFNHNATAVNKTQQIFRSFLQLAILGFISVEDFKLLFKILILFRSNLNSNSKLLKFKIAITYHSLGHEVLAGWRGSTVTPGANVINFFTAVRYDFS